MWIYFSLPTEGHRESTQLPKVTQLVNGDGIWTRLVWFQSPCSLLLCQAKCKSSWIAPVRSFLLSPAEFSLKVFCIIAGIFTSFLDPSEYLNSPSSPYHPSWPHLPSLEANVALVSPWRLETKPHLSEWPWWGRSRGPRLYALVAAFRQICCVCSWLHLLPTNSQLQGIHSGLILLFFSSRKGKNCVGRRTFTLKRIVTCRAGLTVPQISSEDSSLAAGAGGLAQEDAGTEAHLSLVVLPWAPDRGMRGAADRQALPPGCQWQISSHTSPHFHFQSWLLLSFMNRVCWRPVGISLSIPPSWWAPPLGLFLQ